MIQIRMEAGAVTLQPGDKLTIEREGEDPAVFGLEEIKEIRLGDAELLMLSGRSPDGPIRALGLLDPDTRVMVTSPPISDEAAKQLSEELVGRPQIQTFQAIPKGMPEL